MTALAMEKALLLDAAPNGWRRAPIGRVGQIGASPPRLPTVGTVPCVGAEPALDYPLTPFRPSLRRSTAGAQQTPIDRHHYDCVPMH